MQSTMQRTGMAFLECDLRILKPTLAGDTVHVECEVVEARATSRPGALDPDGCCHGLGIDVGGA